nr:GIY-YIG nuclease family protein [uncultured Desulfobulbus sp.]
MSTPILINDLLGFSDFSNLKVRFVKSHESSDPLDLFKLQRDELYSWLLWNYHKKKSFKEGDFVIGFVKIGADKWILFDVCKITKDLDILDNVGYERIALNEYDKYIGRVIIKYKNKSQNLVRNASSVINDCIVHQILDEEFDDDIFPGYENVNVTWVKLARLIESNVWKTALENQKGVYLITDKSNGKMYVGSAYGKDMIHGRWMSYIINGHGGNVDLKALSFDHIKENFSYSILEIYKSTVDDEIILKRESWWKSTLLTRTYGYNKN